MAIYTKWIKQPVPADRVDKMDMYAVIDDTNGRVIAYCPCAPDAERIKALFVYGGDGVTTHEVVKHG